MGARSSLFRDMLVLLIIGALFGTVFFSFSLENTVRGASSRISMIKDGKKTFSFVIHGGAGTIGKHLNGKPYYDALYHIISEVYAFGDSHRKDANITALDIAEYAVKLLENEELFNAGKGSVFTAKETHELEASIMDGSTLRSGAVSLISTVKNPISLARAVMERTSHVYMVGESAEKLAEVAKLERVHPSYFSTQSRLEQVKAAIAAGKVLNDHDAEKLAFSHPGSTGTVGCAVMFDGHVAAATSTGGMTNKLPGRVGDSPIIGSGTYANDNTCAVSATGKGEFFIRHVVAYDISSRIAYGGRTLENAVKETVFEQLPAATGGVIAINKHGEYTMQFNSDGMFRGGCDADGNCEMGIWSEVSRFHL